MIISRTSCLKIRDNENPNFLTNKLFSNERRLLCFRITVGSANVNQTSFYETAASVRMIITIFRTLILMAVNVSVVSTYGIVII